MGFITTGLRAGNYSHSPVKWLGESRRSADHWTTTEELKDLMTEQIESVTEARVEYLTG